MFPTSLILRLINALREYAGDEPVKFHTTNSEAPFRSLENIETFTKFAKEYGVPETSIFASADLYEGQKGPFIDVINCLNELGVQVSILVYLSICSFVTD